MKRLIAATLLLLFSGCSAGPAPTPTPAKFDVKGTLAVKKIAAYAEEGDQCSGSGGYSDIDAGTQVKVSDDAGKIISLGTLGVGTAQKSSTWSYGGTDQCSFDFIVLGVPESSGTVYGVEVANRGVIQFTKDQASSISLTLG